MKLKELLAEKDANLYPRVWDPTLGSRGLWRYKHRDRAAKALGRALKPGEVVHHKNDNEKDASGRNLQVVSRGDHAAIGKPALKHVGCKVPGCKNRHHAKGYCHKHYISIYGAQTK